MRKRVLVAGAGAIGSRFADLLPPDVCAAFADDQKVAPENLGIASYTAADIGRDKAAVCAQRLRRTATTAALVGPLRYTLRPGLARSLDAAVLCLDNAAAIHDATDVLWQAGVTELPVLALTCGAGAASYLARQYVRPHLCGVCLFGEAERTADRLAAGHSCTDTTAPRASAEAAAASARMGMQLLEQWFAGDRTAANRRFQCDGSGEVVARMPPEPSPFCPVHRSMTASRGVRRVDLGGSIFQVRVGDLAEAALTHAGDDAEILLGRRAVPLAGLYCVHCRRFAAAPLRLLPAACAAWEACGCAAPLQPLAARHAIKAGELLDPQVAGLSLAAFGSGHGDELDAAGRAGHVRLTCRFDWGELDV